MVCSLLLQAETTLLDYPPSHLIQYSSEPKCHSCEAVDRNQPMAKNTCFATKHFIRPGCWLYVAKSSLRSISAAANTLCWLESYCSLATKVDDDGSGLQGVCMVCMCFAIYAKHALGLLQDHLISSAWSYFFNSVFS